MNGQFIQYCEGCKGLPGQACLAYQLASAFKNVTGGILPATHPLTAEVLDRILRKVWRLVGARL